MSPPPLGPALAAMTALQALVGIALFAPGVLAPSLGLSVVQLGIFSAIVSGVGMATSLYGGQMAAKFGPCVVASLCALAVALSMGVISFGTMFALAGSAVVLGLAFGPETPASSTLLSKLATDANRPLIFSIRQTGNQIGAMAGSLMLPAIAVSSPRAGFWLIAAIAIVAAFGFKRLGKRYDAMVRGQGQRLDLRAAFVIVMSHRGLRSLAIASIAFAAMQLSLNAFFVSFAVDRLALSHVAAGWLLAIAQAGGLFGRLFWGLVATKLFASRTVVCGLGLGMAAAAGLVSVANPSWSFATLATLGFALGLTASGWNGVFLAEVARLAPEGRVAEATGVVLTASYFGLLLGPILVGATASLGSLSLSYATLAAFALVATLPLLRDIRDQA